MNPKSQIERIPNSEFQSLCQIIRWAAAAVFLCGRTWQLFAAYATTVFVWWSFWSGYDCRMIFWIQFFRSPFFWNVWQRHDWFWFSAWFLSFIRQFKHFKFQTGKNLFFLFQIIKNRWRELSKTGPRHRQNQTRLSLLARSPVKYKTEKSLYLHWLNWLNRPTYYIRLCSWRTTTILE